MTTGLIIALVISVGFNLLLTALILTDRRWWTEALERSHIRTTEYTKDLVDRLGARDWQHYLDETRPPPVLVVEDEDTPEPEMVPVIGPDRGGFGSRHGLRGWTRDDQERLEEEDMPR